MTVNNILDRAMLQSLLDTLGKDALSGLIDGFIHRADEILDELRTIDKPGQAMFAKAHEMKGMAANYGFAELSALSRTLEDQSRADNRKATQETIKKLSDANQRAKIEIKIWLESA